MSRALLECFGYDNEVIIFFVLLIGAYLINLEGFILVMSRIGFNSELKDMLVDFAALLFLFDCVLSFAIFKTVNKKFQLVIADF
jgi:hypothetical protein